MLDPLGFLGGVFTKIIGNNISSSLSHLMIPTWEERLYKIEAEWAEEVGGVAGGAIISQMLGELPQSADASMVQRTEFLRFLTRREVPPVDTIAAALMERWDEVRKSLPRDQRQLFFNIDSIGAHKYLTDLAGRIRLSLSDDDEFFKKLVLSNLSHIMTLLHNLDQKQISSPFANLDETKHSDHFNLFAGSDIAIDQVWTEPAWRKVVMCDSNTEQAHDKSIIVEALGCLREQRVLFLIGPYGVGKTLILKRLQEELISKSILTIFCKARRLFQCGIFDKKDDVISSVAEPVVILIDAADELQFSSDADDSYFYKLSYFLFETASSTSNITYIVSTRDMIGNASTFWKEISGFYCEYIRVNSPCCLFIDPFESPQRQEWLQNFSVSRNLSNQITNSQIKSIHKGIAKAAENPLFLYILASCIADRPDQHLSIYGVYENFIAKTVRGKFNEETKLGSLVLSHANLIENYRALLKIIAVRIAAAHRITCVSDETLKGDTTWFVDPNDRKYFLPQKEVGKEIGNFVERNTLNNTKPILRCYFFDVDDDSCYFTDNNIVHFFVGEYYFDMLRDIVKHVKDGGDPTLDMYKDVDRAPLSPMAVAMMLSQIEERLTPTEKKFLCYGLNNIIRIRHYASIDDIIIINRSALIIDAVMMIAFLHVNEDRSDFSDFFSWYFGLVALARRFNLALETVLLRYLRGIGLVGGGFSGIDLSGVNLCESHLAEVIFDRCLLTDVSMARSQLTNVEFRNCYIKELDLEGTSGKIQFVNCDIAELRVRNSPSLSLEFKFSRLRDSHLAFGKQSDLLESRCLRFFGSYVETLTISDTQLRGKDNEPRVVFENSMIAEIKIKSSDILYKEVNTQAIGARLFALDGKSNCESVESTTTRKRHS
jgi:uncharacterized protein YjbI with pentapeptide repeats